MNIRMWIALAWLCHLPTIGSATEPGRLPTEVAVQAQERIDEGFHLGTVIGVIDSSGRYFYGFGRTSPSEDTIPNQDSIFEIASITKGFTAALVADLEAANKLSATAPISDYVPVLQSSEDGSARSITLEKLLTHTAGLPRNPSNVDDESDDRYRDYTVQDLEAFLSSWDSSDKSPGYNYSNAGLMVVEHAIERQMGLSYEELMQTRVLDPLGMSDTFFAVPEDKRNRLVSGFRDGMITRELDLGQFQAMGGLRSTADDMLTYLGAYIGLVPNPLTTALEKTLEERYSDDEITLSLGWRVSRNEESGKTLFHFTGGSNGFVSFAAFDRENQKAVVVLVNGRRWFSDLGFHTLDSTYPLQNPEP